MAKLSLRSKLLNWTGFRNPEDQVSIVLSIVIGVIVGLTVVAFILLTGRLATRMYPPGGAAWRRVLVPIVGTLVSGYLLFRYFPNARGSGIPQTKFALFIQDGYISLRTVLGKFVACSISLASGIALGREGPSVQIGAGIASVLGRRFGLSKTNVKALLPVGSAAALAAAFNTPIAAVLFSLEEILGDLHAPVLASVVLKFRYVLDGSPPHPGRSAPVSCSLLPVSKSAGVWNLRNSRRNWRYRLCLFCQAAAKTKNLVPATPISRPPAVGWSQTVDCGGVAGTRFSVLAAA